MPYLHTSTLQIPTQDLLSCSFDNPPYPLDKPIYIDADNPSRFYTARQSLTIIRKLAAGFHALGLQKGDCVCLHSFNDVRFPQSPPPPQK